MTDPCPLLLHLLDPLLPRLHPLPPLLQTLTAGFDAIELETGDRLLMKTNMASRLGQIVVVNRYELYTAVV